jgi:hypothetical protein
VPILLPIQVTNLALLVSAPLAKRTLCLSEYEQSEEFLVENVAWISLWQPVSYCLVRPYDVGLTFSALDWPSSHTWQRICIAQH